MYRKLKKTVLPKLISARARILVAVSGGPDSVALGHVLWRYAHDCPALEVSLVITHVHHGVRPESDGEEELVRRLAFQWGVPCLVHHFDAKQYAKLVGEPFQAAAREWRYARWREDMQREKCTLLATAHHLGDQAETVLYRLLRGGGTTGLSGMSPQKDGIIRPFLGVTKEDILNYCHAHGLPFAVDASNLKPAYVRNRIRLELLPELARTYNPRILEALGRTAELLRRDEEYLSAQAEQAWAHYGRELGPGRVLLLAAALQLHPALLSRLVRRAAGIVTGESRGLGFAYVEQIMHKGQSCGWQQDLPGLRVWVDRRGVWFAQAKDGQISSDVVGEIAVPLTLNSSVEIAQLGVAVGLFSSEQGLDREIALFDDKALWEQEGPAGICVEQDLWLTWFSPQVLKAGPLICRNRLAGDKLWLQGVGHKQLKKVFQEAGVPESLRSRMPLIAAGQEVVWIPGVRRSDAFRPQADSHKILCFVKRLQP